MDRHFKKNYKNKKTYNFDISESLRMIPRRSLSNITDLSGSHVQIWLWKMA